MPELDRPTLVHAVRLLDERLQAVVTYGAGGCPTCHDAELRSAIEVLKRLVDPAQTSAMTTVSSSSARTRRR